MSASIRTLVTALAAVVLAGVAVSAVPAAAGLDAAERTTLLSMREEEKLAHDVYVALGAKTGPQVFTRIAASERRHEQAVERVLATYGIADPTDGYAVGSFPSTRFQQLYDELVANGSASQAAALAVGVQIERLDIVDLAAAIRQTDEAMLDRVYGNLRSASQQHLAAFQSAQSGTVTGGTCQFTCQSRCDPGGRRWLVRPRHGAPRDS
ncbi:MAG: DUF2202 domain-containing protein [Gaiellaceae bacterium]